MKSKWLSLLIALAVVISLVVVGCAKPAPAKVITLKYADQNPEGGWAIEQATKPWLTAMEDATGGRVKFEPYYGQTLCKGVDAWESLKGGIADVAWCFHGYWAGMTPMSDVMALPFMPFESAEQASGILWQLYEQYPSISEQYKDNHVLLTWTSSTYFLINSKREVKTLDDFAGLSLRVSGGPPTEMMKLLGVSPKMVGMPDTYVNIQKGVIDGMLLPWEAVLTFRQYEVVKYYTYAPFYLTYFSQSVNLDTWNSLPPDIQQQIESVCGIEGSMHWGKNMFDTAAVEAHSRIQAEGYEMIEFTPTAAQLADWTEIAGTPLWANWVKQMEDAGHPEAQGILDTTLDLAATFKP